jgi:hypothetical protein
MYLISAEGKDLMGGKLQLMILSINSLPVATQDQTVCHNV